jgi:phage N-6-adenine-methyltransferase
MSLGSHQKTVGDSQTWITPRWILKALGEFDLDPAAADPRPWDCARLNLTERDDGLSQPWPANARVFLNPPFHRYQVGAWIKKLADHGRGVALLHARTEAGWFLPCWESASAILFLADRIYFHYPDGRRAEANSGAPACLIAFGEADTSILRSSGIAGFLVTEWERVR